MFRDDAGTPLRVVSVVHDITERKEAERALFFEKRYRGADREPAPGGGSIFQLQIPLVLPVESCSEKL